MLVYKYSFGDFVHVLWVYGIWLDWSSVAYVTIWMYSKLQITNYSEMEDSKQVQKQMHFKCIFPFLCKYTTNKIMSNAQKQIKKCTLA